MKKVIITIDTEGHAGKDPIQHLIWGQTSTGEMGGIPLLMDIFDEYDAKGLFFVDFAEAFDYGKDKVAGVVKYIIQRGHDVGVHIHPDHMADSKKQFLFEYNYDEQFSIISRCTELYKEITGKQPIAFRAGKYGADQQTLEILAQLGYKTDFSQFYGYKKWCHIDPPVTGNESVILNNGLIEIPVMTYNHKFPGLFNRYDKYDINSSKMEHSYLFKRLTAEPDVNVIVMFVHSFSLLNWRQNVDCPTINKRIVKNLEYAMKQVKNCQDTAFANIDNLAEFTYKSTNETNMSVFTVSGALALWFCFDKCKNILANKFYSRLYGEQL